MTTLSLPTSRRNTLAEGLREPAAASTVRRGAPDEWARKELLLRKLGPKGRGRGHQFRNYYESGWAREAASCHPGRWTHFFGSWGRPHFRLPDPSVFLTDRGGIELCWEDPKGNPYKSNSRQQAQKSTGRPRMRKASLPSRPLHNCPGGCQGNVPSPKRRYHSRRLHRQVGWRAPLPSLFVGKNISVSRPALIPWPTTGISSVSMSKIPGTLARAHRANKCWPLAEP